MTGSAKDIKAYFERVSKDWDTMRLDYYDERVIKKMAVSGLHEEMTVSDLEPAPGLSQWGTHRRLNGLLP